MPIVRSCARCAGPFTPRHARHRWCDTCAPTREDRSPTTRTRPSSSTERERIRQIVLRRDPTCQLRIDDACTVESTVADHVIAAADGGEYEPSNLQGACDHCNSVRGGHQTAALEHGQADPRGSRAMPGSARPARIGPTRLA